MGDVREMVQEMCGRCAGDGGAGDGAQRPCVLSTPFLPHGALSARPVSVRPTLAGTPRVCSFVSLFYR